MQVEQTPLEGLVVVTPPRFGDARGFFSESFHAARYAEHGISDIFVQDNHSFSAKAGTVRGLHFQSPPHAQGKLVRCGRGALFDVGVDIRKGSPTFGQWFGAELSFENGKQLFVPKGFLHGFMALTEDCEIVYKCTDYYAPECDGSVLWNDPEIGIQWPTGFEPTLSDKDRNAPVLAAFDSPFEYGGDF